MATPSASPRPARRFAGATELHAALEVARPREGARRWMGRGAALVLGVVLAAIAGGIAWRSARRSERATAAASSARPPPDAIYDARRISSLPSDVIASRNFRMAPSRRSLVYFTPDGDLWIQPVAGGARRRLLHAKPESSPSFASETDLLVDADDGLWEVFEDGTPARRLRDLPPSVEVTVSPDRARMLLMSMESHTAIAGTLRIAPLDERRAGDGEIALGDVRQVAVAWAPTSDALVWVVHDATGLGYELRLHPLDGSPERTLVTDPSLAAVGLGVGALSPRSPDEIAYVRQPRSLSADAQIMAVGVGASRSAPRAIGAVPAVDINAIDALGDPILLGALASDDDAFRVRLSPDLARFEGTPQHVSAFQSRDVCAGWLPDGRVVVTSDREGTLDVFAVGASGQVDAILRSDRDDFRAEVLPGGDVLAWSGSSKGASGVPCTLVRVTPGGAPRALQEVPGDGSAPADASVPRCMSVFRCAASGLCLVRETVGDELVLSTLDPGTGRKGREVQREHPIPATARRIEHWDVSPDGATVLAARESLESIDVATGRPRAIQLTPSGLVQHVRYFPDGKHVALTGYFDHGWALLSCDRNPSSCAVVWNLGEDWLSSPRPSPDGRSLAITKRSQRFEAWLVDRR